MLLAHKRLVDAAEALERKVTSDLYDVLLAESIGGRAVLPAEPPQRPVLARVVVNAPEQRVLALAQAARTMFEGGPKVEQAEQPAGRARHWTPGARRRGGLRASGLCGRVCARRRLGRRSAAPRDARRQLQPRGRRHDSARGARPASSRSGRRTRLRTASASGHSRWAWSAALPPASSSVRSCAASRPAERRGTGAATIPLRTSAPPRLGSSPTSSVAPAAPQRGKGGGRSRTTSRQKLYEGYVDALEEAYRLRAARPPGFADFEELFKPGDSLSAVRLETPTPSFARTLSMLAWGPVRWWFILLTPLAMPTVALLIARILRHGKELVIDGGNPDERSTFEVLTLAMGLGALWPFAFSMWLWSQIDEHTEPFVTALVLFATRAGFVIAMLATMDDNDQSKLERWLGLFGPLAGADLYALIRGLFDLRDDTLGDAFVNFLQLLPIVTGGLTALVALLVQPFGELLDSVDAAYGILLAFLTIGLLAGVGIPLAITLSKTGGVRSLFLRERLEQFPLLDSVAGAAAPGNRAAAAHLFDDSTLWHEAAAAAGTLRTCATRPDGARWCASGAPATALEVNGRGNTISFLMARRLADRRPLRRAGTPPRRWRRCLRAELPGLQREPVGEPTRRTSCPSHRRWPTPATLRPHTPARRARGRLRPGRNDARRGVHGPAHAAWEARDPLRPARPVRPPLEGLRLVPEPHARRPRGVGARSRRRPRRAALPRRRAEPVGRADRAARAGALLPLPALGPVYQVFRQWNLDERRVNEWRMLVQGGAESEKARRIPAAATRRCVRTRTRGARVREPGRGRRAARHGDGLDPALARVAADGQRRHGRHDRRRRHAVHARRRHARRHAFQPTNAQLTTAVRFLLDLA